MSGEATDGRVDTLPGADGADSQAGGGLRRLARWLGIGGNGMPSVRDTLEELIEEEDAEHIAIDSHERAIIKNVLGLRDITAQDVMVPRADIVAVELSTSLKDLADQMVQAAHSRLPVYRDALDECIGMVHIKDVLMHLQARDNKPLAALVREVLFVSPSIRALDLLQQMRVTRHHLALVVDEFGGVDGLITVEDLVEEIVGEISDEHDVEEGPKIVQNEDGTLTVDARATVEEFEALVGPVLSEDEREEIDTLGGLVFSLAGRVATRGEVIRHPAGLEFEVVAADPRRLRTLRVRRRS